LSTDRAEAGSPWNPYQTQAPPPPLQHRHISPGFLKGFFSGVCIIILLSGAYGTFLLLRQEARSSLSNQPGATSQSVPSLKVTPTPMVLYQADWSRGLNGWVGSQDWKTQDGMLISDGTHQPDVLAGPTILAPYQTVSSGGFAIEFKVQFEQVHVGSDPLLFHGRSIADGWQGYKLTMCGCGYLRITSDDFNDVLGQASFDPGTTWHTYRVEVRGSTMTVIVDGTTLFSAQDARFLSGGEVGIKSSMQLMVSSFKITSL